MGTSAQWEVARRKRWKGNDNTRFWEKVSSNGNGCWEWLGAKHEGYGLAWFGKRLQPAHRVCFAMAFGLIPEGLELDHLCRNRACVNPYHLDTVTRAEHARRSLKALATHCKHGHEFTPENTIIRRNGTRRCRACKS